MTLVKKTLQGCCQPKAEDLELEGLAEGHEPQEFAGVQVNWNLKVSVLEVNRDHPISATD